MKPVKYVILDLDGTILDTESLCIEVAKHVVAQHGKTLTPEACKVALGKRPLECWTDVGRELGMDVDPRVLLEESEPLLQAKFADARLLPGALRLMQHLHAIGIPFAIATSTPRSTFDLKLSKKPQLRALIRHVVCGDEVSRGKPAPDSFLRAAELLGAAGAPSEECLVLEDAPSGVEGATAAGMRVVVVPSMVGCKEYPPADPAASTGVVEVLHSLLAFDPTTYGLPTFSDTIDTPGGGVIPMDQPIVIRGTVVKGFGRGSKELGIPTANVDSVSLRSVLAEAVTGIYAGWASIGESCQVYKFAMSIGWNPFFNNQEKTAEPWILHTFNSPFYGQEIRLIACAYVRPEANFSSLQALIDRIHLDGDVARAALEHPTLARHATDPWLQPTAVAVDGCGGSGYDAAAS